MERKYEKPVVVVNEGLAEGVYAASGDGSVTFPCGDCDFFVFNQPVDVTVTFGTVRDGKRYANYFAALGITSVEYSYVVSLNDTGVQWAELTATPREPGHGPIECETGKAHEVNGAPWVTGGSPSQD